MDSALEDEDYDLLGLWDLPEDERREVRNAYSTLERVYEGLEQGAHLQEFSEEFEELAGYRERFAGDVGDQFEEVGQLSEYVSMYLDEFEDSAENEMELGHMMMPLEKLGAEIQYNGNRESKVRGDPGLCLVTNTVAENAEKYGGDEQDYRLWADIEELSEGYEIEIWDNGPGIPAEMGGEKLFQKGVGKGTGEGLHYASEIVELFEGEIEHPDYLQEREDGYGLRIQLQKSSEDSEELVPHT